MDNLVMLCAADLQDCTDAELEAWVRAIHDEQHRRLEARMAAMAAERTHRRPIRRQGPAARGGLTAKA